MFGKIFWAQKLNKNSQGPKIKISPNKFKIQNQHQKCDPTIYNMTMFREIHFGRPPGDPNFDPLPGAQKSNLGQTKKVVLGIILKMPETKIQTGMSQMG